MLNVPMWFNALRLVECLLVAKHLAKNYSFKMEVTQLWEVISL